MLRLLPLLSAVLVAVPGAAALAAQASPQSTPQAQPFRAACSSSYVAAVIGGAPKCLRAGEFCSPSHAAEYPRYGFSCVGGRLTGGTTRPTGGSSGGSTVALGRTVLLARETRTTGCRRGALPDRRCSPGAYYSGLTRAVICSPAFRTGTVRNVPQSEKYAVEREYGMPAALYGRTIEIDHIVPLELGGSNDVANLFPEPGAGAASYHLKDRLENRLHDLVCAGAMQLATARRGIAANWEALYRRVFGAAA